MIDPINKFEAWRNTALIKNYFSNMVNNVFKILPIKESEPETLPRYLSSLQEELIGCKSLIPELSQVPDFLSLLSVIQYLILNEELPISEVKRNTFKAISLCKKISRYEMGDPIK